MADSSFTRDGCILLLRAKAASLTAAGEDRYPKRSDFTEREVVAIKAYLGPWPRALEAAGLKPPRSDDRLQKNREKRILAKRRRNELRRSESKKAADGVPSDSAGENI